MNECFLLFHIYLITFIDLFVLETVQVSFTYIISLYYHSNSVIPKVLSIFFQKRQLGVQLGYLAFLKLENRIHSQVLSFIKHPLFHHAIFSLNKEVWLLEPEMMGSILCSSRYIVNSTNAPNVQKKPQRLQIWPSQIFQNNNWLLLQFRTGYFHFWG